MNNKYIVTTTINKPTAALKKFASLKDWKLIIVGDKKTPKNYLIKNAIYLSPRNQEKYDKKLSDLIGWNCIQRRNFGFLKANELGAEIIATVDDDNIPYIGWGKNLFIYKKTKTRHFITKEKVFDPITATNHNKLWHRGFPLQLLKNKMKFKKITKSISPDIQADFWNGDPDIDAICRMEHYPECNFIKKYFPISSNRISPFNSQNTFISKKVLSNYFMFPHIGRMDDIWASYYVQLLGHKVVYSKPSVYQKRNVHDLTKDMLKEFIGYKNNLALVESLTKNLNNISIFLPKDSMKAFDIYRRYFN